MLQAHVFGLGNELLLVEHFSLQGGNGPRGGGHQWEGGEPRREGCTQESGESENLHGVAIKTEDKVNV